MPVYSAKDIEIQGDLSVDQIKTFEVLGKVNVHGQMTYSGFISKEKADNITNKNSSTKSVIALINGKIVFCGYPKKIEVTYENDLYCLSVICISHSNSLDNDKKDKSFQNKKQTYAQMIEEVFSLAKASVVTTRGENKKNTPILQYHESDWQFTLRMAGVLGIVVIPNLCAQSAQASFGPPRRNSVKYTPKKYSVKRHSLMQIEKAVKRKDLTVDDFISYNIRDEESLFILGDCANVFGNQLLCVEQHHKLDGGIINNNYVFGNEKAYCAPLFFNELQHGLSLPGTVIDTQGQQVKIHLDIDSKQSKSEAHWFDFAPDTNNGMYCMPQIGTKALLQWRSNVSNDAVVIHSIRENGADVGTPDNRYFTTEFGKQLAMLPETLSFLSDSNTATLSSGISINSGKKIQLIAQKELTISSKKRLYIKSPEQIAFINPQDTSSILMHAREIHIKAKMVNTASSAEQKELPPIRRRPLKKVTMQKGLVLKSQGAVPTKAKV